MSEFTFRPIDQWPSDTRLSHRRSQFKASWPDTMALLKRELRHLTAKQIVIQLAITEADLRVTDGLPRAGAVASHPGVILAFESKHGPLKYASGEFSHWQDNLRAIALGLESLRRVDRYGITKRGEQYTGWREIPQTTGTALGDLERGRVLIAEFGSVRAAEKATHPDLGGDEDDFRAVQAAKGEGDS